MANPSIDDQLREQSKILLRKLKEKQGKLQNIVNSSNVHHEPESITEVKKFHDALSVENGRKQAPNGYANVRKLQDTSLNVSVGNSARPGRQKLTKMSKKGKEQTNYDRHNNKENLEETHKKKVLMNKDLDVQTDNSNDEQRDITLSETEPKVAELNNDNNNGKTDVKATVTPNAVRRRKIIDRNVRVGNNGTGNLNESEILRECEEQFPRLNFSYSNVDDADLKYLQSRYGTSSIEDDLDEIPVRDTEPVPENYVGKLENPGNSRQFAKFIRETSKPKSILLSTSQRHNKSSSKVSFRSPTNKSTTGNLTYQMSESAQQAQKMLGYDWIAALMDNDPNAVNQSETFFDDLREFRKNNLEECVNDLYMDGPQELWEHPEREPKEVREALEETKVKPYVVNDRLFSEPIQRSLFAPYDYDENDKSKETKKDPTYEEPRFVRVSIPRSTLMSPHRVKPHRRRSFDNTDTMALAEHCLKGWNTSQPSMMPASSNIGLRDSSLGISSTMKTTLDEAEKLAANYPYHWDAAEQKIRRPVPKLTHRPESAYMDSTGTWPHSFRTNPTSFTTSSDGYKQATDDLLNSTYSLMYEMQRLKKERSDDPLRV